MTYLADIIKEAIADVAKPDGNSIVFHTGWSDDDIRRMADALKESTCAKTVAFHESEVSDETAFAIADMIRSNTSITELSLVDCGISTDGAIRIAEALRENNQIFALSISGNHIGPEAGEAFANLVKHEGPLRDLYLSDNQLGHDAVTKIAAALAGNDRISQLTLFNNGENRNMMREQLETLVIEGENTTLFYDPSCPGNMPNPNNKLLDHLEGNREKAKEYADKLTPKFSLETTYRPNEWREILVRQNAILNMAGNARELLKINLDALRAHIDGLPDLGEAPDVIDDRFRMEKCQRWCHLEDNIPTLNEAGQQFQKAELLEGDGSYTPLLKQALVLGKASALFTQENWEGASLRELKDTLQALPENIYEGLGNRHQLLASIGRDERVTQRGIG